VDAVRRSVGDAIIEERSFVAALLWMTAKAAIRGDESRQSGIVRSGRFTFCKASGLLGRDSTKPPTPLRSAEWGTLRGDFEFEKWKR
jgi:hypothetical protein